MIIIIFVSLMIIVLVIECAYIWRLNHVDITIAISNDSCISIAS